MTSGHDDHGHRHHGHHHGHGAERRNDFDWKGMVDALELDATLALPILHSALDGLLVDPASVRNVLDVGCGPGLFTCELGHRFTEAELIALDSSSQMLDSAAARAVDCGLASRSRTIEADLEAPLPVLPKIDLAFASMVLHHVADPVAVSRGLREVAAPGGRLVMLEFAGAPTALPAGDPAASAWAALEVAAAAVRNERLGLDAAAVDWPPLLAAAGWNDVTDDVLQAEHRAPLPPHVRRWVAVHITRGLELVGDALDDGDVAALQALAAAAPTRDDLQVTVERRILTARV